MAERRDHCNLQKYTEEERWRLVVIAKVVTVFLVEINGENRVVFTGSNVLIEQAQKYSDHMPFSAKITMVDKYFSFIGA